MNILGQTMTNERQAMNYNINVIKFVWRQLRKPSRVTLGLIISQNPEKTPRLFLRGRIS